VELPDHPGVERVPTLRPVEREAEQPAVTLYTD